MKERGIALKQHEVRGIIAGRQTQIRRLTGLENANAMPDLFTVAPRMLVENGSVHAEWTLDDGGIDRVSSYKFPYGQPGDRLWVRETHAFDEQYGKWEKNQDGMLYRATYDHPPELNDDEYPSWRPSIHMPRWASRITLEIVSVRVERLNDISDEDAKAEGVSRHGHDLHFNYLARRDYRQGFEALWESINGAGSWQANPLVWVIEFKRVQS